MPRGGKRPGAGRPRTGKRTVQLGFCGSLEDRDSLDRIAEKRGVSRSSLIRQAVRRMLCPRKAMEL